MAGVKRTFSTKVTVVFPDVHLAAADKNGTKPIDRHDPQALSTAFKIAEYIRPDRFIQLGDLLHLGQISGWQRKKDMLGRTPSEDGETISTTVASDIALANVFWDTVQSRVKASEYDQLEGNHDLILKTARMMSFYQPYVDHNWYVDKALNLKERGVKWTPYERINGNKNWVEVGKLYVCHGFYSSSNHLNKHFDLFGHSVLYGHLHTYAAKSFQSVDSQKGAWCVGTLSTKQASYIRSAGNSWRQGMAVVYSRPDGSFNVYFIDVINGVASWAGKLFTAGKLPGLM